MASDTHTLDAREALALTELAMESDLPPYCALHISLHLPNLKRGENPLRIKRVDGQTLGQFAAKIRRLGWGSLYVARGSAALEPLPYEESVLPRYWTHGGLLQQIKSARTQAREIRRRPGGE